MTLRSAGEAVRFLEGRWQRPYRCARWISHPTRSIVDLRRDCRHRSDAAVECAADLWRVQAGRRMVALARIVLRASGVVSTREWIRTLSRDDQGPKRNRH